MKEDRDHDSGDDFISTEGPKGHGPDLYVYEYTSPAPIECQDLIAAARTYLPRLIHEIQSYRSAEK
jgi:hypothetical protein